jgi:hypothetical protein
VAIGRLHNLMTHHPWPIRQSPQRTLTDAHRARLCVACDRAARFMTQQSLVDEHPAGVSFRDFSDAENSHG